MTTPKPAATEMAAYIDIDRYNRYEEGHPGYQEMMRGVVGSTIQSCTACVGRLTPDNRANILEIGSGTGNYTRRIGAVGTIDVEAVEIDDACNRYLRHKIAGGIIRNTTLVEKDFLNSNHVGHQYHAVNTTFADHHFSPLQKPIFLQSIRNALAENGEYILGDEFLPPHDEKDPAARVAAQIDFHGMIIEEAFKEGKVELPNLELDALVSGLRTTVRFIQQTTDQSFQSFALGDQQANPYNENGIYHLHALIQHLKAIDTVSLQNPEDLDAVALPQKRATFIGRLENLAREMKESRQPGLEESEGKIGGDYKMTIRQYTDYLDRAGLKATGYFVGPKPVGDEASGDHLDTGYCTHPIALVPKQNHTGGVWVIRAMENRYPQTPQIPQGTTR